MKFSQLEFKKHGSDTFLLPTLNYPDKCQLIFIINYERKSN